MYNMYKGFSHNFKILCKLTAFYLQHVNHKQNKKNCFLHLFWIKITEVTLTGGN
jgi:hypothetical protein